MAHVFDLWFEPCPFKVQGSNLQVSGVKVHLPLQCPLKKASLLSSSGGSLSRPRHVPSSFVASVSKEVRHVNA